MRWLDSEDVWFLSYPPMPTIVVIQSRPRLNSPGFGSGHKLLLMLIKLKK